MPGQLRNQRDRAVDGPADSRQGQGGMTVTSNPTVPARRRQGDISAATRAALLALARQYFGERGYVDTSLEEITTAAQLTRGALYYHFGSKAGLFIAVVDDIDREIDATVTARSAPDRADRPTWDWLRMATHCYLDAVLQPHIGQIVVRDAPTHYPGFYSRPVQMHCRRTTIETLSTLAAGGQLRLANPCAAAHLIEGAVAGLTNWASMSGAEPSTMRAELDAFLDSLRLA